MTKWFDTNYHYLVPEIGPETNFALTSNRIVEEFEYALANGVETRPYIVGPVTFLLLSKASDDAPAGFSPLSRLEDILPVYTALLQKLAAAGASWVQLDEPALVVDQDTPAEEIQAAVARSYEAPRPPRPSARSFSSPPRTARSTASSAPSPPPASTPCTWTSSRARSRPQRPWPRWATRPSSPASWTATTSGATTSPPPRRRSPS